jgi:hypothetical protein
MVRPDSARLQSNYAYQVTHWLGRDLHRSVNDVGQSKLIKSELASAMKGSDCILCHLPYFAVLEFNSLKWFLLFSVHHELFITLARVSSIHDVRPLPHFRSFSTYMLK